MRRTSLLVGALAVQALASAAQNPADSGTAMQDSVLRVFFDCPGFASGCDFDFMRTEITFVSWVRDRADAQVHVLISTQQTGGGGEDYTVTFLGRLQFAGQSDTLHFVSGSTDTGDEVRRGLARVIKLGLIRFVAGTPVARRIEISYAAPQVAAGTAHDPWNYWAFRISVNANYSAEKSSNFFNIFNRISANRTTDAWKTILGFSAGYNESNYHFREDSVTAFTFTNIQRNYGADAVVVRSLGSHWSVGLRGSVEHSTFLNQDYRLNIAPALEYNIFPYSQSTRRFLSLQYAIGVSRFVYRDTTIYGRTQETLPSQTITLSLSATQPWGSTSVSAEGSAFLRHGTVNKNRLSFFGNAQIRIFKGFNFNFFGSAQLIHDQLFLSKEGVDETTLLLRRRQLETSFRYSAFIGLSYRFGSIFNNVVNPRFDGGGGGGFFFN